MILFYLSTVLHNSVFDVLHQLYEIIERYAVLVGIDVFYKLSNFVRVPVQTSHYSFKVS